MTENAKRKAAPTDGQSGQQSKKKKTGNAGKWKTPQHEAKAAQHQDASIQPGDAGIWVTCARHQELRAAREIEVLFAEYAQKMYGIKGVHDTEDTDGDDAEDDIEAAIQKELAALDAKGTGSATAGEQNLTPIKMSVDCLLFVKTRPPIDPVAFVRRICEDAESRSDPSQMRCRYVNRLTPVTATAKATEQGLVELAKEVLGPFFDLSGKRSGAAAVAKDVEAVAEGSEARNGEGESGGSPPEPNTEAASGHELPAPPPKNQGFTFAIRPTIRNHSNLKRDTVINSIAALINDDRHKVNLTTPDKVILIDIYQAVCGMSVVDGNWEELKRFNLTELYSQARAVPGAASSRE